MNLTAIQRIYYPRTHWYIRWYDNGDFQAEMEIMTRTGRRITIQHFVHGQASNVVRHLLEEQTFKYTVHVNRNGVFQSRSLYEQISSNRFNPRRNLISRELP